MNCNLSDCSLNHGSSIIYSLSSGICGVSIRTWVPNTDTPIIY